MRDRAQHGGLDLVRAAQRAGLDHLAREPLPFERGREERLERGLDRLARASGGERHEQRAEPAVAVGERDRGRALVVADRLEHEPARGEAERLRDPLRGRRERAGEVGRAEQDAGELGGEVGLAPALLGLLRPVPGRLGEARGRGRDDQEHDERDPVLRLGDRQAARSAGCGRS